MKTPNLKRFNQCTRITISSPRCNQTATGSPRLDPSLHLIKTCSHSNNITYPRMGNMRNRLRLKSSSIPCLPTTARQALTQSTSKPQRPVVQLPSTPTVSSKETNRSSLSFNPRQQADLSAQTHPETKTMPAMVRPRHTRTFTGRLPRCKANSCSPRWQ